MIRRKPKNKLLLGLLTNPSPRIPVLKIQKLQDPFYKPVPTLRLVKLSTILENPDQGRESDDTNMMEISEDKEQDRSYEEPSASTIEGTSSSTSVYAIQKKKKKKKKVTFTSSQINQLLTKSNSSSNTSMEITSDDAPITTHQKQKEIDRARQVQQTRGEEGQAQITKPALVITTNIEPQQQTSVTWALAGGSAQNSEEPQHCIIIYLPPSVCQTQPQP